MIESAGKAGVIKVELTNKEKAKSVASYVFLPQVVPRAKNLFGTGFSWTAMLIASLYAMVRLLPPNHPYLNPQNKGRFTVFNVISEAAKNLTFSRKNIDQIVMFFTMLLGVVLLFLQVIILIVSFVLKPAAAAPPFASIFYTTGCAPLAGNCTDIAYQLLDIVFAIPGFFGSTYDPNIIGGIPAYNQAIQALLEFYSLAILVIGVIIFIYYIVLMVGETAQTGSPFGRRFQHIWTPIRLVVALGLLLPLNYGLNSAQYITLGAARAGSSMATNGWILFNNTLLAGGQGAPIGMGNGDASLFARPTTPPGNDLIAFMSLARTCRAAYEFAYGVGNYPIDAFVIWKDPASTQWQSIPFGLFTFWTPTVALNSYQDVVIRFGNDNPGAHPNEPTGIGSECGQITLPTTSDGSIVGVQIIMEAWLNLGIKLLWSCFGLCDQFAERMAAIHISSAPNPPSAYTITPASASPSDDHPPTAEWADVAIRNFDFGAWVIAWGVNAAMIAAGPYPVQLPILQRGWAGAGIWYNTIAELNGALMDAAHNLPVVSRMPKVMEEVEKQRRQADAYPDAKNRYRPYLSEGNATVAAKRDYEIAMALNGVYLYWLENQSFLAPDVQMRGDSFTDAVNFIFGTRGLFNLRENKDIHPMAQLVALGKGIMNATVRNLAFGLGLSTFGGVKEIYDAQSGGVNVKLIGWAVMTVASIGLTVGFLLFYILPFIPFMYFFFAVGGWVKGIFEAMVGTPLWALAHLRIDGNGLPGDTASNGYFLIFEIFVRPILTVFGLLASVVLFSATVMVLHDIFPLATESSGGFDGFDGGGANISLVIFEFKRSAIDELFYTVVYAILVYMLGNSAFKMIDMVPNNILRWMGAGVQSFGDQSGDPVQGLSQYAAFSGASIGGQVIDGAAKAAGGAGNVIGRATNLTGSGPSPSLTTGTK
jgi:hypothetical protein